MCVAKWTQTGEGHRGSVMGDFQCECDMHAALGEGGGKANESRHIIREEQTWPIGIQGRKCYF